MGYRKEYYAEWAERNKEYRKKYSQRWRKKNKEKLKEYYKEYTANRKTRSLGEVVPTNK